MWGEGEWEEGWEGPPEPGIRAAFPLTSILYFRLSIQMLISLIQSPKNVHTATSISEVHQSELVPCLDVQWNFLFCICPNISGDWV